MSGGSSRATYAAGAARFSSTGLYSLNNDYRNTVLSGRLRFTPDSRSDVTVSLRHGDDVFHYPTDGAGRIADRNQFQTGRHTAVALDAGRVVTPRLEARVLAGVSRSVPRINDGPDSTADSTDVFYSHDVIRRVTIEPRADLHAGPGSRLTLGGSFERESQEGTDGGYGFGDTTNVHRANRAVYAQLLQGLAAPLSLTLGARLDDNQQFGTFATYRIGASWRLHGHTRVRASLGTGFKEPTFFENYAKGFVLGNPDLDPERSRSWEIGVERAFAGSRLAASLTWFDQRFRDLIEFTFTPAPPDSVNYFNVAGATARGVEAAVTATPGRGISAAVSYTYLRTRVTDPGFAAGPGAQFVAGQRLLRRPGHAATASLIAPAGARGVVSAEARYVGRRDDLDFTVFPTGRVTLPAYLVVGLALRMDLTRPGGSLPVIGADMRVDNLFGARYQEAWNFPARGRVLLLGARLRFGS